MQKVIRLADVANTQPKPPENWRELMKDYIDKLNPQKDYYANERQYSKAKLELMQFVPLSRYDEMLRLLIAKLGN